jgi:hypothetical protein
MAPNFLSVRWHEEAFHGLGDQGVEGLIPVGDLFPLPGGRRKEGKKKRKEEREKKSL